MWYESGTFWPAVAAVVTLLGVPATAYITYRVANPERRLQGSMSTTRLLATNPAVSGTLEVQHNGAALAPPRC